jgi:hypothetical protein
MTKPIKVPPFGKFLNQLKAAGVQTTAGVETESARGFWGGVTPNGEIVLTAWIDQNDGQGRFKIWRPKTNHGGLKDAWEMGNIRVGTEVRAILIRQRGNVPPGKPGRSVAAAALMPGKWRVVEISRDGKTGFFEPA